MAVELAFVLINPYTIAKSRTGGIIARVIARTDLKLVGARMFGPSEELAKGYADIVRNADPENTSVCELIADYILCNYSPDKETGASHRVMMLLFEGEDAIKKIWDITGSVTLSWGCGETVRDTYGDDILDSEGGVQYFEPAVLVAPSRARAGITLKLWASFAESDGGIIEKASDVSTSENCEKTLVMLKPDSFNDKRAKAGNIIDMLSLSGLRIVAVKKFSMTVSQAEEFYGPVKAALTDKFAAIGSNRAAKVLSKEFGFDAPPQAVESLCRDLGPAFAHAQFEEIVDFMTGYRPSECEEQEKQVLGSKTCVALVYEGVGAVEKIRSILGATDPGKARPGSVRREFGTDIMVNAAHASDSVENARREMTILNVNEDSITDLINEYYG